MPEGHLSVECWQWKVLFHLMQRTLRKMITHKKASRSSLFTLLKKTYSGFVVIDLKIVSNCGLIGMSMRSPEGKRRKNHLV